jgi:hypothetical protein
VRVLYVFGFEKVGVVLGDLYFIDPHPLPGQEGPERGARLEVRLLEQGATEGSIYSSRPISVGVPVWRADLLESADDDGQPFDRTHHHPSFRGWEPSDRLFDDEMSANPVEWIGKQLTDLSTLLANAGFSSDVVGLRDAADLRQAVPEIQTSLTLVLARVRAGELATPPPDSSDLRFARVSWL